MKCRHRDYDEPLISVPEETPKRKKSAASSRQFCGKGSKRGEQQAIKINNCFEDAVNVVYTTVPKTVSIFNILAKISLVIYLTEWYFFIF